MYLVDWLENSRQDEKQDTNKCLKGSDTPPSFTCPDQHYSLCSFSPLLLFLTRVSAAEDKKRTCGTEKKNEVQGHSNPFGEVEFRVACMYLNMSVERCAVYEEWKKEHSPGDRAMARKSCRVESTIPLTILQSLSVLAVLLLSSEWV